jgi:hypothetical protein
MTPKTQKSWFARGTSGVDSLQLESSDPIPEVGDNDVLVKCNWLNSCEENFL